MMGIRFDVSAECCALDVKCLYCMKCRNALAFAWLKVVSGVACGLGSLWARGVRGWFRSVLQRECVTLYVITLVTGDTEVIIKLKSNFHKQTG